MEHDDCRKNARAPTPRARLRLALLDDVLAEDLQLRVLAERLPTRTVESPRVSGRASRRRAPEEGRVRKVGRRVRATVALAARVRAREVLAGPRRREDVDVRGHVGGREAADVALDGHRGARRLLAPRARGRRHRRLVLDALGSAEFFEGLAREAVDLPVDDPGDLQADAVHGVDARAHAAAEQAHDEAARGIAPRDLPVELRHPLLDERLQRLGRLFLAPRELLELRPEGFAAGDLALEFLKVLEQVGEALRRRAAHEAPLEIAVDLS